MRCFDATVRRKFKGRQVWILVVATAVLLAPAVARANGAFPDSFQVLLPEEAPDRIYLGTNFGVLVSDDGGARWSLSCEEAVGTGGMLYQLGWTPGQLFAATLSGVSVSGDGACNWSQIGTRDFAAPSDVFVDRAGRRVFALARPLSGDGGLGPMSIWVSAGAADAFARAYTAPDGAFLTSVESAQSDPTRLYAAELQFDPAGHPYLLRSDDSGATWQRFDLKPVAGEDAVAIAAVDPADPDRVFLRLGTAYGKDALLISEDGGATVRNVKALAFPMTAFLLRPGGELLIATNVGEAWVSRDRGATFERRLWPHVRGLGERGGTLYAVTSHVQDGFALASSTDGGKTWLPLMDLRHLCGVLACGALPDTCDLPWQNLSATLSIAPDACDRLPVRTVWQPPPEGCGSCGAAGGALGAGGALVWAVLRRWRRRSWR